MKNLEINFKKKMNKYAYGSTLYRDVSLLEWTDRVGEIISETENDRLIHVCLEEHILANIYKLNERYLVITIYSDSECKIPSEWLYKDWLYFWDSISAAGYSICNIDGEPYSFGMIDSDEFYLKRKEIIGANLFQICFCCHLFQ